MACQPRPPETHFWEVVDSSDGSDDGAPSSPQGLNAEDWGEVVDEDGGGLCWLPLARVRAEDLTYERFLMDFALPKVPFVLLGAGDAWPARRLWTSLDYFLEAPCINRDFVANLSTHRAPFDPRVAVRPAAVGDALRELRAREHARGERGVAQVAARPRYLAGWAYHNPGGSEPLDADVRPLPRYFGRSPAHLAESPAFGAPGRRLRWLYIGEAGSVTRTHFDVLDSSAWLWCVRGRKRWRCVHGGDRALIPDEDWAAGALPELFAPDVGRFPWLRRSRLYQGVQEAGDIVFTPSSVLHAVQNLEFAVSLTHNFVDATNFCEVLREQLGRSHQAAPTCAPPRRAGQVLRELAALCGGACREATLAAAAAGAEADGSPPGRVRLLIEEHWRRQGLDGLAREAREAAASGRSLGGAGCGGLDRWGGHRGG